MFTLISNLGRLAEQQRIGFKRHINHEIDHKEEHNHQANRSPQDNVEILDLEHGLEGGDPFTICVVVAISIIRIVGLAARATIFFSIILSLAVI